MTFIARARGPAGAVRAEALFWLDGFIAFVALERVLILRGVAMQARRNLLKAFSDTIRIYAVVLAHALLYYALDRKVPGSISYVDFNSAFAFWQVFTTLVHRGRPSHIGLPANVPLRIRWVNLFVADFVWVTLKVLVGLGACYLTFIIFPDPAVTGSPQIPNVPLFFAMFLLAGLTGAGVGLMLEAARQTLPVLDAVLEVLMWFGFVTSGIYEPYTQLPAFVADYFALNPMMSIIEYGRAALSPGYPVGPLTLIYPIVFAFVLITVGFMFLRQSSRVETL